MFKKYKKSIVEKELNLICKELNIPTPLLKFQKNLPFGIVLAVCLHTPLMSEEEISFFNKSFHFNVFKNKEGFLVLENNVLKLNRLQIKRLLAHECRHFWQVENDKYFNDVFILDIFDYHRKWIEADANSFSSWYSSGKKIEDYISPQIDEFYMSKDKEKANDDYKYIIAILKKVHKEKAKEWLQNDQYKSRFG